MDNSANVRVAYQHDQDEHTEKWVTFDDTAEYLRLMNRPGPVAVPEYTEKLRLSKKFNVEQNVHIYSESQCKWFSDGVVSEVDIDNAVIQIKFDRDEEHYTEKWIDMQEVERVLVPVLEEFEQLPLDERIPALQETFSDKKAQNDELQ